MTDGLADEDATSVGVGGERCGESGVTWTLGVSSPSVRGGPRGFLSVTGAKLTSSSPGLHSKSNPLVWSARSKSAEALLDGIWKEMLASERSGKWSSVMSVIMS